jgi:protein involved in polysaccharide export with SLBB domain
MNRWKARALVALLAVGLSGVAARSFAQESLDQLVEQSLEQETELGNIPAEIPGQEEEPLTGRVRLPKGEEVERLRISQDRKVDPETYIVGPGDVFQVYVWGEFDRSYPLQVDPEGNVLIPTVGLFRVADLTLAEVKESIGKAALRKYPGVEITTTLTSMRFFTVYVTGAVFNEGNIIVNPVTRVSNLIEKAGGYLDELRGASVEEEVDGKKVTRVRQMQNRPASRRSIRLTHQDGTVERIDLDMFHATGRLEFNPYVRMGDAVHVEFRRDVVYLYGSVNREGAKEFQPGDTIGTLFTLSGALVGDAPLEEAYLWRFLPDGRTNEVIDLAALAKERSGALSIEAIADFPLQPKDMIFLRTRSDWQQTPTVFINGEVKYRGRYRILAGQTRLRDIVEQAGGLTADASLAHASLIRVKYRGLVDPELNRLRRMQATSGLADMSPEERAYLKTKSRQERGRIAVDFERLFQGGDTSQNILLDGGDVIFIPEKRTTVSLSGQLKKPGLIPFEEGARVSYYLNKAGGYAWKANKGDARLIRARTGLREKLENNLAVEPGDEIWIPEKEYRDWWAFTQGTVRTIAEALTLVVLARSF